MVATDCNVAGFYLGRSIIQNNYMGFRMSLITITALALAMGVDHLGIQFACALIALATVPGAK